MTRTSRRALLLLALGFVALAAGGCQFRKSAFANAADNAGSEYAAAAATLQYLHDGKLPRAYAEAAFVSYRQALRGVDARLRTAGGAPAEPELAPLLHAVQNADEAIAHPCLSDDCDWQGQIAALRTASDALLAAADAP